MGRGVPGSRTLDPWWVDSDSDVDDERLRVIDTLESDLCSECLVGVGDVFAMTDGAESGHGGPKSG